MPVSLSAFFQYAIFLVIAYILAGAPLLSTLYPGAGDAVKKEGKGDVKQVSYEKIESLMVLDRGLKCEEQGYRVHVLGREPLVVYVEGFLSEAERKRIVELSTPNFQPSTIWTDGKEHYNPSVRKSEKAPLDPKDHTIQCIASRAQSFQGWRPSIFTEKLWSQRYTTTGHYMYHYDFSNPSPGSGRVSTFMVYVDATNVTGGGTNFPRLKKPEGREWCRFIYCPGEDEEDLVDGSGEKVLEGVTFRPISGNAVFWENLREDGTGYRETWHAGLPVRGGVKIGLNVWSWLQEGYVAPEE